jgi:hypothetical protein
VIEFRQMAKGQEGADEMTNYLVFGPKIVDYLVTLTTVAE